MRSSPTRPVSLVLTVVATVWVALTGCGVSGKASDAASTRSTTSSTTEVPTTVTTEPTSGATGTVPASPSTGTTLPDRGGNTTIPTPGNDGTTIPQSTSPFGAGAFRSALVQIYKQAGYTDKEARCLAEVVLRQTDGGAIDPRKLDLLKLGAAARQCLGDDGARGGSD